MRSLLEYPRQGTTRSKIRVTPLGRQAHIYFNRRFYSSNSLSRLISVASVLSYLLFQLQYVDSAMPYSRPTALTVRPASTSFNTFNNLAVAVACLFHSSFSFGLKINGVALQ